MAKSWTLDDILISKISYSPNSTIGIIATLVAKSWTLDDILISKIYYAPNSTIGIIATLVAKSLNLKHWNTKYLN